MRGKRWYVSIAIPEMQRTSTFSMLTVDRRRLLEWIYIAELSYLPLERQEMLSLLPLCIYMFASQDGCSHHILPLILIYYQCNDVNARSLLSLFFFFIFAGVYIITIIIIIIYRISSNRDWGFYFFRRIFDLASIRGRPK